MLVGSKMSGDTETLYAMHLETTMEVCLNQKKHINKRKILILFIVIIGVLLIFFPRSINMVLNKNYITECDEVEVIIDSNNFHKCERTIIKDKAKIRKIYDYLNSHKGRWSPQNGKSSSENNPYFRLIFRGDKFGSIVHIYFGNYIRIMIDDWGEGRSSEIFFKIYGKGIDSEELIKLLNIEVGK